MDAEIATEFKNLNEKLDSALTTLYGCEESGQPGLRIRVDRIEQRDESRGRIVKWIGGLLVVVIGERLTSYLSGKN